MHVHADCPRCHSRGTITRPSGAWRVALVGAYATFMVMIFGAGLLGPTIMAVLPLLMAFGLGVLPFVHERAGAPASCTACGTIATDEAMPTVGAASSDVAVPVQVARAA